MSEDEAEVWVQVEGQPRWKVMSTCTSRHGPDHEWIKSHTGLDPAKVERVRWNGTLDMWVIHMKP